MYLLNVVPRTGIIRQIKDPSKSVQAISNCNVYCLAKNTIPSLAVGNNLSISSTHIQHNWIISPSHYPPHFNMCYAVINCNYWLLPKL